MPRIPIVERDTVPNQWSHTVRTYTELGENAPDKYASPITMSETAAQETEDIQGKYPPLYGTLAHNPPIVDAMRAMFGSLRRHGGMSESEQELVTLTIARELSNRYYWNRHVTVAVTGPVTKQEIRHVAAGEYGQFDRPTQEILTYAAEMANDDVTDRTFDSLAAALDCSQIAGLTMYAGFYVGVIRVIESLDISPAGEFIGWDVGADR